MQPMTTTQATPFAVSLEEVSQSYGEVTALDRVSWGFRKGSLTAIMGPSGSGKSTFLHCASGLDPAQQRNGTARGSGHGRAPRDGVDPAAP